MYIECLCRKDNDNLHIPLSNFLSNPFSRIKYGKSKIFMGDIYYIPYYAHIYNVLETGEEYIIMNSSLADDIFVLSLKLQNDITIQKIYSEDKYVLNTVKNIDISKEEVNKKLHLNNQFRKLLLRYKIDLISVKTIYIVIQTFYVQCKTNKLFLVDTISKKVDFKHFKFVEKSFIENYLNDKNIIIKHI